MTQRDSRMTPAEAHSYQVALEMIRAQPVKHAMQKPLQKKLHKLLDLGLIERRDRPGRIIAFALTEAGQIATANSYRDTAPVRAVGGRETVTLKAGGNE